LFKTSGFKLSETELRQNVSTHSNHWSCASHIPILTCFSVYLLFRFNSGKRIVKCVRWRSRSFSQSHTLRYEAFVRYETPRIWFTYWN
jgi:hypothetical protein